LNSARDAPISEENEILQTSENEEYYKVAPESARNTSDCKKSNAAMRAAMFYAKVNLGTEEESKSTQGISRNQSEDSRSMQKVIAQKYKPVLSGRTQSASKLANLYGSNPMKYDSEVELAAARREESLYGRSRERSSRFRAPTSDPQPSANDTINLERATKFQATLRTLEQKKGKGGRGAKEFKPVLC